MKNWFKVSRNIFESKMWNEKPFDRSHAWLDMVGNANYKDGTIFIRGNEVEIKRGQLAWSIRFMSDRWGHTQKWIEKFLKSLKRDTQITIQKTYPISLISIINYEKYQSETRKRDTQRDTQEYTQTTTILNKDKKEKNNIYNEIILHFNETTGRKARKVDERAVDYWLGFYSLEEIKSAILKISGDEFWKDKMDLTILFRRKNPQGEAVDYISQLLNRTQKLSMKRFDTL